MTFTKIFFQKSRRYFELQLQRIERASKAEPVVRGARAQQDQLVRWLKRDRDLNALWGRFLWLLMWSDSLDPLRDNLEERFYTVQGLHSRCIN